MNDERDAGTQRARGRAEDAGAGQAPRIARFAVLFLLLSVGLTLAASTPPATRLVHEPLQRGVARIAMWILAPFGESHVRGASLDYKNFGVEIVEACDGVLPSIIFLAAVLAFPSRWRDKALGALIGLPSIFAINLVRVVTLMFVGAARPEIFEQVHIYVWQAIVIACAMGLWVFWAERFVRPRAARRP